MSNITWAKTVGTRSNSFGEDGVDDSLKRIYMCVKGLVDTLECCHCLELWVFERNLFPLCQYLRYKKQKLLLSFIQSTFHLQLHFVNVVPTSTVPAEEILAKKTRSI